MAAAGRACWADRCRRKHLAPYLPGHRDIDDGDQRIGAGFSAAPYRQSPSILPISWAYCLLMGGEGLTPSHPRLAVLNANYIAARLSSAIFKMLYTGDE